MEFLGEVRDRSVCTPELLQNAASRGVRKRGERGIQAGTRILNHLVQYVTHELAACKGDERAVWASVALAAFEVGVADFGTRESFQPRAQLLLSRQSRTVSAPAARFFRHIWFFRVTPNFLQTGAVFRGLAWRTHTGVAQQSGGAFTRRRTVVRTSHPWTRAGIFILVQRRSKGSPERVGEAHARLTTASSASTRAKRVAAMVIEVEAQRILLVRIPGYSLE